MAQTDLSRSGSLHTELYDSVRTGVENHRDMCEQVGLPQMKQMDTLECLAEYLKLHPERLPLIDLQLDQILLINALCTLYSQNLRELRHT